MSLIDLQSAINIRFETFQYGNPLFNKPDSSSLDIDIQGGCVGFLLYDWPSYIYGGLKITYQPQDDHWLYKGNSWTRIDSTNVYDVISFAPFWIGSYDYLTITNTGIVYATT